MSVAKRQRVNCPPTFTREDREDVKTLHQDVLVIKACVAEFSIPKILMDTDKSADIIYGHAFDKITDENIHKMLKLY